MTRLLKNLIRGAGSVLEIHPDTAPSTCYKSQPPVAVELGKHWHNVGKYMQTALDQYGEEIRQIEKR